MISEALRLLRIYHNIRQARLALDLKISTSYLSEIETGKKKVTIDILESYSAYFKVPLSSLFFFAEELSLPRSKDHVRSKVAMATLKLLNTIAGTSNPEPNEKDISD